MGQVKLTQDIIKRVLTEHARQGGKVGGPARALALSPAKRRAIAKKGALARWGKRTTKGKKR